MKGIVPLSVLLAICIGLVQSEAGSKDEQPKQLYNNVNSIGSTQKPDLLSYQQITQHYVNKYQPQQILYQQQQYQPRTQQLQQALPYNHQPESIKRPYLAPQQQSSPVAMVIIAQPAYIPASMLQQGNVAHQLLQYFQNGNTQARYQYIPANHQPVYQQQNQVPIQTQQIQHYVQYQPQQEATVHKPVATTNPPIQAPATQSPFASHESLPTPQALISQQHHVVPHHLNQPSGSEGRALQYQHFQQPIDYQPQQLQQVEQQPEQNTDITRLAQQAAQHFLMNGGLNTGSRTAPAIITGLEHFSPEQQEKIKAQLSAHFGSPLKPLSLEGVQNIQEQEATFSNRPFYQDQRQKVKNNDKFIPSIQVKDGEITQTSASG